MEFTLWLLGFVYASLYAFTYDPVLAVSTLSPDMTQSTRAAETTASYTEYLNDSMTTTNVNFEPDLSKEEAENINNKAKSFLTDLLDGIDPRLRPDNDGS
ncbi:hypothetical protein LSH36_2g06028 [Paralvinella palmiformis]|uniref:Uncharacterized protein n=1 Tax=Paralvinella palmiformis TaxID=53620 RepID=A0AAD9KF98_9ANNE|nr:hypothetical protein LSH36_2g06028 [Paralvinella palmiformis]